MRLSYPQKKKKKHKSERERSHMLVLRHTTVFMLMLLSAVQQPQKKAVEVLHTSTREKGRRSITHFAVLFRGYINEGGLKGSGAG